MGKIVDKQKLILTIMIIQAINEIELYQCI